jgi:glutamate formiminotransferase
MNVTDYRSTSLLEVFEFVREDARKHQVEILSSQIVGLVPQEALEMQPVESLCLESFSNTQILENRIRQVLDETQDGNPSHLQPKWK